MAEGARSDTFYPVTPEDIIFGFPLGHEGPVPPPRTHPLPPARQALEAAVRRALQRPPCVVAFSGGRDSSAILALAVSIARAEGLPEPIAVTRVFADAPGTDEGEWQELVVRHLRLADWERVLLTDELDLLGDLATARLREHGVLWSPLLHTDVPVLERARGGSVLDGEAGDELFDSTHRISALASLLRRDAKVSVRNLKRMVGTVGPYPAVHERVRRRNAAMWPWLRDPARAAAIAAMAADHAARPRSYRRSAPFLLTRRSHIGLHQNRRVFALAADVEFSSPFTDPDVVHGVARIGGTLGFPSRTAAMRRLFDDLLPDELLARRTKTYSNGGVVRAATREFVESWDGSGVDATMIDPEALQQAWREPHMSAMSWMLLQSAWLAGHRSRMTGTHR